MASKQVGVVVVTYRAAGIIEGCLAPLLASPLSPRVLVVNSSSDDGTVEIARDLGAEAWVIPRGEFNHGLTREAARKRLGTEIAVMLTPDCHLTDPDALARLVRPIQDGAADVAYGRQLPRPNAGYLEALHRGFSYPVGSQLRDAATRDVYGSHNHFCSNAFSAWRQSVLDAIGGFPATLVSEETVATARILAAGGTIAYAALATAVHSHPSDPVGDFRRQFDVGYTREAFKDDLLAEGGDMDRGLALALRVLTLTARQRPGALLAALVGLAARFAGYRLGRLAPKLSPSIAAAVSQQDFFWATRHAEGFGKGRRGEQQARRGRPIAAGADGAFEDEGQGVVKGNAGAA